MQQKSWSITKDIEDQNEELTTIWWKEKSYAICERELRKTKNELGVEIKIQSPKYKLHLLHEESIK
jgi:hypothetical protein